MSAEHQDKDPDAERKEATANDEAGEHLEQEVAQDIRDKRRHPRFTAPLTVQINGHEYEALDWSLSGFRIGDVKVLGLAGERVHVHVILKISDFDFKFDTTAEMVRLNPTTREAGFAFTGLTSQQVRALAFVSNAFLSGRLKSVDGLLRNVSAASESNDEDATETVRQIERRRVWVRNAVFALLIIIAVLSARAAILSLTTVESAASWVDARQVELRAPGAASIERVSVAAGSVLQPGQDIAQLRNRELELELTRTQSDLDYLIARRDVLADVREGRGTVLQQERETARLAGIRARERRDEAAQSLAAAKALADRLRALPVPGETTYEERARAEQAVAEIAERLALAETAVEAANAARRSAATGFFVGDARATGFEPASLDVEIVSIDQQIAAKRAELEQLTEQKDAFRLTSPCHCEVQEVLLVAGERARAEEAVIILSELESRSRVVAFIKHESADKLRVNQQVTVRLADGRRDTKARITHVRTVVGRDHTEQLLARDLNPERYAQVEIVLSEGFSNAPASPVSMRVYSPFWRWLAHGLHL